MTRVTQAEFKAILSRRKARKAKRIQKVNWLNKLEGVKNGLNLTVAGSNSPKNRAGRVPPSGSLGVGGSKTGDLPSKSNRNSPGRVIHRVIHRPIKTLIKRGPLKKQIVRLLGLLDAKVNGKWCQLGNHCPAFRRIGYHSGEVAYHLVPQKRGDAARFLPENVIWACSSANFGEMMNREIYRDKHVAIFGRDRIEAIEAISRTTVKYSMADLLEIRDRIKRQLEL